MLAVLLVLAACSSADDRGATTATASSLGPDAIVLRIPIGGGAARAYRYPALDSVVWRTRAALPANVRPLAFNIDAGTLALTDSNSVAWRLTLGSGQLERAFARPLSELTSLDGSGIFGMHDDSVYRLTSTDATPWHVRSDALPSQLQPLRDGGVLIVATRAGETRLSRYRPPAADAVDTAVFQGSERLISAAGGDRYYLSDGPNRLRSVRANDLETLGTIELGDSIITTASSPSGDRVYVLGRDGANAHVQVINKYGDAVVASIAVPVSASALRMDPLGRYLLVRHGPSADSVLVVGIATDDILGRFASPWRDDLPLVFPDGRLATLRGADVVILSAGEFTPETVVAGGAADLWTVVQWNGFRRRAGDAAPQATAALIDTTATRARAESSAAKAAAALAAAGARSDSSAGALMVAKPGDSSRVRGDSSTRRLSRADSIRKVLAARADSATRASRTAARPTPEAAPAPPAPLPRPAPAAATGPSLGERGTFVVQFAALKAERAAQQLASAIRANGERARVVTTSTNGIALYRVILGPFRSRSDAERAGQAAGRDYWVFEGGTN
jgi:cell division septation protein DedD